MGRGRGRFYSWTEDGGVEPNHSRPPIVVWCSHGIVNGNSAFVQRYRFDISMGRWNPTDYTAEGATHAPNVSGAAPHGPIPPMFDDEDNPVALSGEHFTARCKRCSRLVAMNAYRAQVALTRLSDAGLTDIPLAALQRAYDEAPRQRRH
ncbi:hypothetical protein MSIM_07250 [Mycobacterium simiae]|nr:hypothetical protein MSIM_07250 [Mycobacterium simiae]